MRYHCPTSCEIRFLSKFVAKDLETFALLISSSFEDLFWKIIEFESLPEACATGPEIVISCTSINTVAFGYK